jgi:hypothetical protein
MVPGFELVVHGEPGEVASRLAAWRSSPHAPLVFDAKAGRVVWSDVILPGLQIEALQVTMSAGSKGDGSLVMDSPSVTTTLPRGALGPWRGHLESTADETKVTATFDRSKEDGTPNVTLVTRATLGTVVDVMFPRTKLAAIGVSPDLAGLPADAEVALTFEGQAMPGGQPVSSHGSLSLSGVPPEVGAAAGDLGFEWAFAGDTGKPIHMDSALVTVGKTKTSTGGWVSFDHEGVHVDVDRPGAAHAAQKVAPYALDTREWTGKEAPKPPPPPVPSAAPSASAKRKK